MCDRAEVISLVVVVFSIRDTPYVVTKNRLCVIDLPLRAMHCIVDQCCYLHGALSARQLVLQVNPSHKHQPATNRVGQNQHTLYKRLLTNKLSASLPKVSQKLSTATRLMLLTVMQPTFYARKTAATGRRRARLTHSNPVCAWVD